MFRPAIYGNSLLRAPIVENNAPYTTSPSQTSRKWRRLWRLVNRGSEAAAVTSVGVLSCPPPTFKFCFSESSTTPYSSSSWESWLTHPTRSMYSLASADFEGLESPRYRLLHELLKCPKNILSSPENQSRDYYKIKIPHFFNWVKMAKFTLTNWPESRFWQF